MTENMKKGDLVWIPSNTTLVQFKDDNVVHKFIQPVKPSSVLVIGEKDPYYKILYEGSQWYVRKGDTYNIEEKNNAC